MRAAWYLAQEVKIKTLEDNLFEMKFQCLGDWETVTLGGLWVFWGKAVLFAEYDGYTKPSTIPLYTFDIWIQIHDMPPAYTAMVPSLAGKVGTFITAEPPSYDFSGNFH